jgi:hypothetical protein
MWHAGQKRELHVEFWLDILQDRGPLERPRRRWENNIKVNLKGVGWDGVT